MNAVIRFDDVSKRFGSQIALDHLTLDVPSGSVFASFAFLGDQLRRKYRFLAHQGASPRLVWWSRQALWMPIYLGLALLTWTSVVHIIVAGIGRPSSHDWSVICLGLVSYFVMAYPAGQFASLWLRSGLLAPVAGLALAIASSIWAARVGWYVSPLLGEEISSWRWLGLRFGLPLPIPPFSWWWSVAPLPVALLLATRLHTGDWLVERRGWIARLKWLGPPLITLVVILAVVPFVRVYSVPASPT